ncbi:MAG TPA: hypothetical protein VK571_07160 [Gemmatimonadaceae bacterium]|nr:hypothetical protein [Gemmatimonadaceae bacterium]
MTEQEPLCNLCGLTCQIGRVDVGTMAPHGLVLATVIGGYESTPGNGYGALDDLSGYRFSLCEWCCDWLFSQFRIPVKIFEYALGPGQSEEDHGEVFRPAEVRVREDEWRSLKAEFFTEKTRRDAARMSKP